MTTTTTTPCLYRTAPYLIASYRIVQQLGNYVGDSYHWELARSVIRIVIAPIIIGLCKPALSVVISLAESPSRGTGPWSSYACIACTAANCWPWLAVAMLTYSAACWDTWAQMVARFVRLPPRQLIPKWMFSVSRRHCRRRTIVLGIRAQLLYCHFLVSFLL